MTVDEVRALIERGIPGARVEVTDLTGTGDHFAVRVEAATFRGLPLVRQHMMVNSAVAGHMEGEGGTIHALKIETVVPGGPGAEPPAGVGATEGAVSSTRMS